MSKGGRVVSTIICVNSFREGAGKTTVATHIAALLAAQGQQVCLIDANFRDPNAHTAFQLDGHTLANSLSDYLIGKCAVEQAAYDVTASLNVKTSKQLYVVPAGGQSGALQKVLNEGYNPYLFRDGLDILDEKLRIDFFVIDTRAGLGEQTLPLLAITNILVVVMLLDKEDYQGTGVIIDVANKIDVPVITLIINKVTGPFDEHSVKSEAERAYKCRVAAVLPHADNLQIPLNAAPDNPLTVTLRAAVTMLMNA
jgi:MinD-like ATPase involved in chromosome partitioning or flagellar assembly